MNETEAAPMTANFSTLILSIAHSAKVSLGEIEHPTTKKTEKNLPVARYNIDLLMVLQEKTKANLTEKESQLISSIISDLQMQFVNRS